MSAKSSWQGTASETGLKVEQSWGFPWENEYVRPPFTPLSVKLGLVPILGDSFFPPQRCSSLALPNPSELKMFLKGETLPTPCLAILNEKLEERICRWPETSAVLVSPASVSPSSDNGTLILPWDIASPPVKVTWFVCGGGDSTQPRGKVGRHITQS